MIKITLVDKGEQHTIITTLFKTNSKEEKGKQTLQNERKQNQEKDNDFAKQTKLNPPSARLTRRSPYYKVMNQSIMSAQIQ